VTTVNFNISNLWLFVTIPVSLPCHQLIKYKTVSKWFLVSWEWSFAFLARNHSTEITVWKVVMMKIHLSYYLIGLVLRKCFRKYFRIEGSKKSCLTAFENKIPKGKFLRYQIHMTFQIRASFFLFDLFTTKSCKNAISVCPSTWNKSETA
jgi:hypothetical protein